jgi:hypothetical protein
VVIFVSLLLCSLEYSKFLLINIVCQNFYLAIHNLQKMKTTGRHLGEIRRLTGLICKHNDNAQNMCMSNLV